MSKRTPNTIARPRDFWATPPEAVMPLVPYLRSDVGTRGFVEPCAGAGALVDALAAHGVKCTVAFDIAPQRAGIRSGDASKVTVPGPSIPIVTNPPWKQALLEPILENIIGKTTVWLLLPLDYVANLWTNPFMAHVSRIVPVGRVSWLGNGQGGFDNVAWFRFSIPKPHIITERKRK